MRSDQPFIVVGLLVMACGGEAPRLLDLGSDSGVADAGTDAGCGADLSSDPQNCGRCGRSCAGGFCQGGTCQPVVLSSNASSPCRIAVDSSGVYWANSTPSGTVVRMSHTGTDLTVLASGRDRPFAVALSGGNVFWTEFTPNGSVARVPKSGGNPTVLASGQVRPRALAAAGSHLWWANFGSSEVVRAPIEGGTAEKIASSSGPYDLAFDGAFLYWTSGGSQSLFRSLPDGSDVTQLATWSCDKVMGCVASIAVDGRNVYLALEDATQLDGKIFAIPTDGGTERLVASGQKNPASIAFDEENVYWVALGTSNAGFLDGEVWSAPISGGAALPLATSQPRPCGVATHDGSVYWTRAGDDRVMRRVIR